MCRSQAEGGRRRPGQPRTNTSQPTAPTPAPTISTPPEPTERQRAALQHLDINQYEHVPPPPPRVKGRMSEQRYYDTYDSVRDVTVIDTDGTIFKNCGAVTAHVIAKKQQPGVLVIRPVSKPESPRGRVRRLAAENPSKTVLYRTGDGREALTAVNAAELTELKASGRLISENPTWNAEADAWRADG